MSQASQANVLLNNGVQMPLVSCEFISFVDHYCLTLDLDLVLPLPVGTFKIKGPKTIEKCLDAAFKAGYRSLGWLRLEAL